ncbi:MAG: flagellar hook-length control protein FliK, partial [Phycisphaerales bacterium JB041]
MAAQELAERARQTTFGAIFAQLAQSATVGVSRNGTNALSVGGRPARAFGQSQLSDSLAAKASGEQRTLGSRGAVDAAGTPSGLSRSLASAQRRLDAGHHARGAASSVDVGARAPGPTAEAGAGTGRADAQLSGASPSKGPGASAAQVGAGAGAAGTDGAGISGAAAVSNTAASRTLGANGAHTALASLGRATAAAPGGGPTTATSANAVALGGRTGGPGTQPSPSKPAATPRGADPSRTAAAFRTQVAQGLSAALRHGRGEVTLRLTPKALGELRVSLTVQNGSVDARVKPATAEAHRLLEQGIESLRHALEARGLKVGRIEIDQPPAPKESGSGPNQQDSPTGQDGQTASDADGGRQDPAEPGAGRSGLGDGVRRAADEGPQSETDVLDTPTTGGGPGVVYG